MNIFDLYTDEYLAKQKECFDACLSKEFLQDLQEMVRKHYDFNHYYRIGDWDDLDTATVGINEFVTTLAKKYGVEDLITFLNSLQWYEYDYAMDTIFSTYGRKFHLYTPKRRYRNIFKANTLFLRGWEKKMRMI